MATKNYMQGRMKWARPQGLLFSNDAGTLDSGFFVPQGTVEGSDFLILSDHGRAEINMSQQRVENRMRTINATMRSYHTADKLNLSVSWKNLPSRSFSDAVLFDSTTGKPTLSSVSQTYTNEGVPTASPQTPSNPSSPYYQDDIRPTTTTMEYTADGGAGGVQMLEWYEDHPGPFYVYLAYDKYSNFGTDPMSAAHLGQYSQVIHMYFASFDYVIAKRGGTNHDLWNVNLTLEEV